jgi:hypothetical protein
MVLNATFNNISVISWRSILLVEETGLVTYSECLTPHITAFYTNHENRCPQILNITAFYTNHENRCPQNLDVSDKLV